MAIKTKEEMFGDGAGFGTAVPYSTAAPGGHSAGNRGIAFGEQLTSAIANRTHYALALNDEDLNSRLALFESTGLNAAYSLGALLSPGSGRFITKSGGPVETQSVLGSEYGDDVLNAHYRADTKGDLVAGSVGFDYVSDFDPTEVANGNGSAGFIDRRAFAVQAGFASAFGAVESALLNPGGAVGSTVRITDGSVFWSVGAGTWPPAGNYTNLILGVDLVSIEGAGAANGVYVITALGAAGTDVVVRTMNGDTPVFSSDTAATVTVFRIKSASFGTEAGTGRTALQSNIMVSSKGGSALDLISSDEVASKADALRVRWHAANGALSTGGRLDRFGRFRFSLLSANLPFRTNYGASQVDPVREDGGAFATLVTKTGTTYGATEVSHLVLSRDNNVLTRADFTSLHLANHTGSGIDLLPNMAFAFNANSNVGSVDLASASLGAGWQNYLTPGFSLVEIHSPTRYAGFYRLSTVDDGSAYVADGLVLLNMNGTATSHFPASGTGTLSIYANTSLGRTATVTGITENITGVSTITPYNVLSGGLENNSVALTLASPDLSSGASRAFIRAYNGDPAGIKPIERFAVTSDGSVHTDGNVELAGASSEVEYSITRSRSVIIDSAAWVPRVFTTGSVQWTWDVSSHIATQTSGVTATMVLDRLIPAGAYVTQIQLHVSHATHSSPGKLTRYTRTPVFGSITNPTVTAHEVASPLLTGWQTIALNIDFVMSTVQSNLLVYDTGVITSGADILGPVRITYNDPGPRNY